MGQFGIGQPVRRKEDDRFVTGRGRYTDDISLPGQAHMHVLRSPHAHARFKVTDTAAARAAPGVLGVYTAADLGAIGGIPCKVPVKNRDGSMSVNPPYPILPADTVKHVGDAVAIVVAETAALARDAAELVAVDYTPLPAVADTAGALAPGAALVWEQAPGNQVFDWEMGDKAATDAAFARAHHVTRLELVNNRIVVNSMEARGAIGDYDPAADRMTLYTSSQGSHSLQAMLADYVFNIPAEKIRVVTPDVGGGFGMKLFLYREYALVMWAARALKRPVKWACDRSDAFVSDTHGRDHVSVAELALDKDGVFIGFRINTIANLGAYLSNYGPFIPTMAGSGMLAGLYKTPAIHVWVRGVFTNTVPVDAYRGAGRPEAAFAVERIVDKAARELGIGVDEIRRRNFIPAAAMPFTTALGETYDSGDFTGHMEKAMKNADWAGFAARKAASRAKGRLRGIGLASYVEACGGGSDETASMRVDPEGEVLVLIGTQSNGQGHETAYAQIVSEHLGLPMERIRILQGDTDVIPTGRGTGGSRSLPVGGVSLNGAAKQVAEKAKAIASHLLEAAEADIEIGEGVLRIAGTDRSVTLWDVAREAARRGEDLTATHAQKPVASTYPNGTHVVEVEIDPDTGMVGIDRYTVVDDFGIVINPLLLAGQVHGGVGQGVGQALYEGCVYDETGQLLTGSLMDYCLPRADNVPHIAFDLHLVPSTTNAMGMKGAGEAGAIGAPPAVINAIIDALAEFGVEHIDMPATPQKIWSAIQAGRMAAAAD